jgi:hypothetical protein
VRDAGKYLYGIIGTDEERNFGPVGLGGWEVETIAYRDLSAVISNVPMGKYVVSRENLLAHQQVLEQVMKEFTVLPVRFYTVAANAEEIRRLLERRYRELKHLLRDLDGKVELGVKALWKNVAVIFREIVEENEGIKHLRAEIAERPSRRTQDQQVTVGKMVQVALEAKKEREGEEILRELSRLAAEHRLNRTIGDRMLLNAAFLVERAREKEFDDTMEQLDRRCGERVKFAYVGPVPPYNFVNVSLRPDE